MRIIIILLLSTLVGCATSYTCKDYPTGKCQTVSEVYRSTKFGLSEQKKTKDRRGNSKVVVENKLEGNPLLIKPKVIRIYMNNWEDKEGDLHVGGYLFVKVKGAEWNI